jgi:fatty-acyl-CoA synthase
MAGYCEDPENTDEAFGDGWLNTGELARRDEDRHLYFACRIKGDDPPDAP